MILFKSRKEWIKMKKIGVLVILLFLPFVVNAKSYKNETLAYIEKENVTRVVSENSTASIAKLDKEQNVMIPENPKTGDGIGLIVIGVVVSLVGICVAVMLIKED